MRPGSASDGAGATDTLDAQMYVPRVPGLGLLLDSVYFDSYNRKFAKKGSEHEVTYVF